MTDYAKDFITEMGDYIYTSDKLTQSDGEIYSLPWESRVTAMWYRSDLYDSAPQSWDDLLEQSSKASTDTSLGFALGLSEDGNGTGLIETFIPWIRSAGGDFLDKDGKAVFNSDAGVKVVNFIKELVDNGSMDQTTMNMAYDDVVDDLFEKVRDDLIAMIQADSANGEQAADLLMVAKYFERIGDHATNIAEWVIFALDTKGGFDENASEHL